MTINISERLKTWVQFHVEEARDILGRDLTNNEEEIVKVNRLRSRFDSYQLLRRMKRKFLNGTYPLPSDVSIDSVFLKSTPQATELFDRYIQIEADMCQAADKRLFTD